MDYYGDDDYSCVDSSANAMLLPKIQSPSKLDRNATLELLKHNNEHNFVLQNIKKNGSHIKDNQPHKRNLSLSTTLLSGKLFDSNMSPDKAKRYGRLHIMKDENGSDTRSSVKSLHSFGSQRSLKELHTIIKNISFIEINNSLYYIRMSCISPSIKVIQENKINMKELLSYKVPRTILRLRIAHKKMPDKREKESIFDELAKRKNIIPSPSKYIHQYNWSKENKGNRFGKKKRVSLLEELMEKGKGSPGPLDYSNKPRRSVKGSYKSFAPRTDAFDDIIANSMDVPPPNTYDMPKLDKIKVNLGGIVQFSKLSVRNKNKDLK